MDYELENKNLLLFSTDAAKYMVKAASFIKKFYLNLHHITCKAHLIHNCALKIKSYFTNVDNLIATIKGITVKNCSNRHRFQKIGNIPDVIPTRWSSWLKAAIFYAKNFVQVKQLYIL